MHNLNAPVDIYCERNGLGLWAEPLNAASNLAFFMAAFAAFALWRRLKTEGRAGAVEGILALLILLIAIGSTLFHTLAVRWTSLADTLQILFYQMAFCVIYSRHVMRLDKIPTVGLLAGFIALTAFTEMAPPWLNGSMTYIPALLFVGGLGVYHWRTAQHERFGLLAAFGIFCVSLSFRALDMRICPILPIGLHYMWHMLNAAVLYLSFRACVLRHEKGPA